MSRRLHFVKAWDSWTPLPVPVTLPGQESAGIASVTEDNRIVSEKERGYVADVFTPARLA